MRVVALYEYPVKSVGGVRREALVLGEHGPALDRRYMLIDAAGKFVTGRTHPRLLTMTCTTETGGVMVHARGAAPLWLPHHVNEGPFEEVHIWGRTVVDAREHEEASAWFSARLGEPLRCMAHPRGFADAYPLLIVSEASLQALNARLDAPIDMRRFRPNIVVDGLGAHKEDDLTSIDIGTARLRITIRCERCSIPQVDPDTGTRGVEPARTLASYRRDAGKIWFGVNASVERYGTVHVGQTVAAHARIR